MKNSVRISDFYMMFRFRRMHLSFIEDVSIKFHESNNTQELMQKLTEMQTSMQKEPLPVTRTEFENRAVLYRILYDLEELITIKKRFIETLTPDEIKRFWNTSQNCCQ